MNLTVTSSPHIRSNQTVTSIMLDVIIALLPATAVGIYYFGMNAALIVGLAVVSAVVFEYLAVKLRGKESTIGDLSAVVTGLLIGLNLPAGAPFWLPVVASAFGIVIVKQVFGGLGHNFMNPALGARVFLLISFAPAMTAYTKPFTDTVSSATPMTLIGKGEPVAFMDLFLGNVGGVIGETCAAALIVGGLYLIFKKVIGPHIPLVYIGTVFILTTLLNGFNVELSFLSLFGGGLMLGAFFMATDYVTIPMSVLGQIVFALGCGVLTTLIRLFGAYPEGVMFAILLMNVATPMIERYTAPRVFGRSKR